MKLTLGHQKNLQLWSRLRARRQPGLRRILGEFEGMDSDGESETWTKIYSRDHVHFRAPGEHDLGALAFEGW
jgi:hypothetical protein